MKYYSELSNAKEIAVSVELEAFNFEMIESRAELLISNVIKYSMPESKIYIILKEG